MDDPRIALAASPRDWPQRLHRYVADHGGARVKATVLHPTDALAEDFDVFVADDTTSFLSKRLVDDLHSRGRTVLGVYDPDDESSKGELLDVGVDDVLSRDAHPADFVTAVAALSALTLALDTVGGLRSDLLDGSSLRALRPPEEGVLDLGEPSEPVRGLLTAVGAASGGVGATEVAVALASAAAVRGQRCALVDADDAAPALAQRLGVPSYPNLRAAVAALERRDTKPVDALTAIAGGGFTVLPGLSSARNWSEQRPAEAVEVLGELSHAHHHVIANVGHLVEDLHGAGAPQRYGLTRQVLAAADTLLVVTLPTPVGLARLLDWLADLRLIAPGASPHVVFNRTAGGTFKRGELVDELSRTCTPASLWFLPADPRVEAGAWAGELAAEGPFTRAVASLAEGIWPPVRAAQGGPRRRWRR